MTRQLFSAAGVDVVMSLPPEDRQKVGLQMMRIADRAEARVAREAQANGQARADRAERAAADARSARRRPSGS
ncbi:hypothetical protein ACFQU7_08740 [Pseudoroseomonas wenyumeiae]